MDAVEHVAVTPGTPAEHTKQFPVLAFRADAQRSAKQPAQSRMNDILDHAADHTGRGVAGACQRAALSQDRD